MLWANIGSKSAISLHRGPVYPKFQVEGVAPTNHSSQKTRLNVLSYGIKIKTYLSSVLLQCTRLTDGRTDRRKDRILIVRPRLHSIVIVFRDMYIPRITIFDMYISRIRISDVWPRILDISATMRYVEINSLYVHIKNSKILDMYYVHIANSGLNSKTARHTNVTDERPTMSSDRRTGDQWPWGGAKIFRVKGGTNFCERSKQINFGGCIPHYDILGDTTATKRQESLSDSITQEYACYNISTGHYRPINKHTR